MRTILLWLVFVTSSFQWGDVAKSTVSEVFGLGALSNADALADALGPCGYSCGCGSGP